MRYLDNVSSEPLDIIRRNECESQAGSLATSRFRALWNEIERLRGERDEVRTNTLDSLRTEIGGLWGSDRNNEYSRGWNAAISAALKEVEQAESNSESAPDPGLASADPLRPAEPEEIAAAWRAWHSRHGGRIGPGPAFVEAINAAFAARRKGMEK